nr:hypothetical protein [Thiocapsa sp.]
MAPYVPQFRYDLHDISARNDAEIKGELLTRLIQLALRNIYSDKPRERLRELLDLIDTVIDQPTALDILESLLRYYTERAWVFRKAGCVPRASGQGAPTRRSGPYGEEVQRRPGVRGACHATKNPRALGIWSKVPGAWTSRTCGRC